LNELTLSSPAKINLALRIVKKRADGYHELRTILQKISLYDEIELRLTSQQGISVTTDDPSIPSDSGNLAYRAAQIFLQSAHIEAGISIHIRKNIPAGAGLGGGSSNAAAVLTGLNKLTGSPLTDTALRKLGLMLGADVPFFIYTNNTARAGGIGERLSPVTIEKSLWFIVIYPGFSVSTAWAYQNYKILTNDIKHIRLPCSIKDSNQVLSFLVNDLEQVVFEHYPEVKTTRDDLIRAGAIGSLMSGSGSSVFGIFPDREQAQKALSQLTPSPFKRVFVVNSLVDS
jgi:4-diphosphocytidyl-2-C-methyl-D-erythritol kinase